MEPAPDLELLLQRHARSLRRLAFELVRDPVAADDAVQQTWLNALRHPPQRAAQAQNWLATVLRHVVFRTRRGDRRRRRREQHVAREPIAGDPAEHAARIELGERLFAAVRGLAEPYGSTIWQRYFEELPPREIAARAGVPLATVKSRLQRGLQQLRERLGEGGESDWRGALVAAFGFDVPEGTGVTAAAVTGGVTMAAWSKAAAAAVVAGVAVWLCWPAARYEPADAATSPRSEVAAVQTSPRPSEAPDATLATGTRQVVADIGSSPSRPLAIVRGRCVDGSGAPLDGCRVRLRGSMRAGAADAWLRDHDAPAWRDLECRTAADGGFVFEFEPPPPFQFQLLVDHETHVGGQFAWSDLEPTAQIEVGDIEMPRGVVLTGVLVDQTGAPMPGESLTMSMDTAPAAYEGVPSFRRAKSVTVRTGDDGRFRAGPLPHGVCTIEHHRPEPVRIVACELLPDRDVEELRLVTERTPDTDTIRGRVVDHRGQPIARAEISTPALRRMCRSEPDGSFTLVRPVAPDEAVPLSVRAENHVATTTAPISWGSQDVEITLASCAPLTVRVLGPDDRPVRHFSVRVEPRMPTAKSSRGFGVRARGPFDDGTAVVTDVEPGSWTVVLEYPTTSGLLTSFTPIEMTTAPLRLDLRAELPTVRTVRVLATTGEAIAGARVQVCELVDGDLDERTAVVGEDSLFRAGWTSRAFVSWETTTDGDGRGELRGPASHPVALVLPGPGHVPLRTAGVSLREEGELTLHVEQGGRLVVELAPPGAVATLKQLQGLAPDAAFPADSVPHLSLHRAVDSRRERQPGPGQSTEPFEMDAQGRFELSGLAPGTWNVQVTAWIAQGNMEMSKHIGRTEATITAGATTALAIDLSPFVPGTLEATVLRNGVPVADSDVQLVAHVANTAGGGGFSSLVSTDAHGCFRHVGQPGEYEVEIRRDGSVGIAIASKAIVRSGETTRHTFEAWSGRLRLVITDPGGEPAANVRLLADDGARRPRLLPPTDADGAIDIELAAGTVRLFTLPRSRMTEEVLLRLGAGASHPAASQRIDLGTATIAVGRTAELELCLPPDWLD